MSRIVLLLRIANTVVIRRVRRLLLGCMLLQHQCPVGKREDGSGGTQPASRLVFWLNLEFYKHKVKRETLPCLSVPGIF
jgi:hypothetical protein